MLSFRSLSSQSLRFSSDLPPFLSTTNISAVRSASNRESQIASGVLMQLASQMSLAVKSRIRAMEDWWFDTTRSVHTSGNEHSFDASRVVGHLRDSLIYGPVRAANARRALHDLPIRDYSQYTFLDIGSGKGRVLFLAAELPFRKVAGVEFATELHRQACDNIRCWSRFRQKCVDIESINADAAEFEFPDGNLVIYLFNPFGPEIMTRMLANLKQSIEKRPRHVIILMLWPEQSRLVEQMPGVKMYKKTRRYHIYQTEIPPASI